MDRTKNILAVAGLATGVVFGLSGSFAGASTLANILYAISSIGLILACAILALHFFRKENDLIATGFLVFAIGEAVMHTGTAAGDTGGQAAFAAGMSLYLPGLLLISIPKYFPLWVRLAGIATVIPFAVAAFTVFAGGQALPSDGIVGAGYGLLSLTITGWVISFLSRNTAASPSPALG